ncbi:hypothetical protein HHI36_008362 [Cryptolaemus montrouzieri]|uniref:RING-type E3 ubiquitin transferase n=1 Tax=Cryptolaemus montrouzieri TaxID=559131 RepID=A0ABD2MSS8_9CUCU
MGAIISRQHAGVEEVDVVSNHAYKYPPRSGNYFGSHFIMGGERFDTPQPESYLFGENSDLNFLGCRPTPFPYPPPQPNEPTKTLKCLVNIRKESLRFVRSPVDAGKMPINKQKKDLRDIESGKGSPVNIEFTFDCDVRCAITIYYFCTEEFGPNGVTYVPRDPSLVSETYHYKKGANQQFCQMSHVFDPAAYSDDELLYDVDREIIPIAIHIVAEGPEDMKQSHTTIATVEKITDGIFLIKALKQKLFVDGLCYLLQEIYGIENKNNDKLSQDDDLEDNGSECVICMCDVRDTLILPCRHLCLCNSCADSLRYQANNCPICRAPFRALLQIRALHKCVSSNLVPINSSDGVCDNIPPGYEAISLIEALNGPCQPRQPPSAMPDLVETPESEHAVQAAQILNRHVDRSSSKNKNLNSPEYGSLVINRDQDGKEPIQLPFLYDKSEKPYRSKDNMKHINEKIPNKDDNVDEDSETEKLSPLLQKNNSSKNLTQFEMTDLESYDVDTDHDDQLKTSEKLKNRPEETHGEDSDYYTPEDPNPTSIYEDNIPTSSLESTPQKHLGTPHSHSSTRSSGDSYSSGNSTKRLLTVIANDHPSAEVVHI